MHKHPLIVYPLTVYPLTVYLLTVMQVVELKEYLTPLRRSLWEVIYGSLIISSNYLFELDEDPDKQEKLTTGIEYLNYSTFGHTGIKRDTTHHHTSLYHRF